MKKKIHYKYRRCSQRRRVIYTVMTRPLQWNGDLCSDRITSQEKFFGILAGVKRPKQRSGDLGILSKKSRRQGFIYVSIGKLNSVYNKGLDKSEVSWVRFQMFTNRTCKRVSRNPLYPNRSFRLTVKVILFKWQRLEVLKDCLE